MTAEFYIHDDGVVSLNGEHVGDLITGDDGMACVEFKDGHQAQNLKVWFCGPNPPFYS